MYTNFSYIINIDIYDTSKFQLSVLVLQSAIFCTVRSSFYLNNYIGKLF